MKHFIGPFAAAWLVLLFATIEVVSKKKMSENKWLAGTAFLATLCGLAAWGLLG